MLATTAANSPPTDHPDDPDATAAPLWPAERQPPRPWFFGDTHAVRLPLLDDLPELLGIKPEAIGAQQRAVDGARLVDLPPHIRAVAVETLRTLTHVVVWAGAEDVSAAEKMLQKSPRRPLPGFFRADFSNLLSVLAECCGPGVRPIVVRVATPNASLSAAVNDVLSSVAEKAAIEVVWVEPVWEAGSAAPATAADENAMSLAPVPTLDYRATLAKVVEALVTTPSM
jgi:hypothetical protein